MTTFQLHPTYRFFIGLLCLFPLLSKAQTERPRSIFEVLTEKEAAKMTLETDLTTIIEQKRSNQYFPGTLRTDDGKVYRVEVKPRGKFRRKISAFPPLKIKFKKKELLAQGLDTLNEIKLVLPCYETDKGDELIIREYLAYRMFEKLTDASLRARLIRLTIRDTHVEKAKKPMFAILLEDEEELEKRLNGVLSEDYGVPVDSLHSYQSALTVMFQYMIGNTDWDISMLRNIRMLRAKESGKLFIVPYDFDFSGLVSAPYATPSSDSGLKTVRDRFLMNYGLKPEVLKRALNTLRASKQDFYSLCKSKYLRYDASEDMLSYLRGFFERVEKQSEIPQMMRMETD
jgi:hypothetical protein